MIFLPYILHFYIISNNTLYTLYIVNNAKKKKQTNENENANNNCGRRVLDSFFFDNRKNRTQMMKGSIVGRSDFTKNKTKKKNTNMSK